MVIAPSKLLLLLTLKNRRDSKKICILCALLDLDKALINGLPEKTVHLKEHLNKMIFLHLLLIIPQSLKRLQFHHLLLLLHPQLQSNSKPLLNQLKILILLLQLQLQLITIHLHIQLLIILHIIPPQQRPLIQQIQIVLLTQLRLQIIPKKKPHSAGDPPINKLLKIRRKMFNMVNRNRLLLLILNRVFLKIALQPNLTLVLSNPRLLVMIIVARMFHSSKMKSNT